MSHGSARGRHTIAGIAGGSGQVVVASVAAVLAMSAEQARKWQALKRQAVENAWVIPTFFARDQRLAGTNVGPIYLWPAYHTWPYGEMYITR